MKNFKSGLQYISQRENKLNTIKDIILTGDTGCTGFDKECKETLEKILTTKTDLFFILGDLVKEGSKEEFNKLIDFCDKLVTVPIFSLCGNHDMPDYEKALGFNHYAIILENFTIISLDNSTAPFSTENLDFLKNTLEKYNDKKTFVFFHVPPPTDLSPGCMQKKEWESLKNILDKHKQRIEYIFVGHIHGFQDYHIDGYHVIITGGGGAKLSKPEKDTLCSHHAIKLNLENPDSISFEIILLN
jgi:3',5'-cyclic AMP phosphodiesterase CpdA